MKKAGSVLSAVILSLALAGFGTASEEKSAKTDSKMPIPEIAFEKFVLDNGLTLVVHEDHKAPIVAVNVWYHVGSKNEKTGKTGFAHLFEHLMFNGSENFNDDYFKVLERVGATDLNGTTNTDRTNYFQNVPKNALDLALWMESDRMGHLLGAVTQEKLDEQRGVVQNEKRQGENQPYGQAWNVIFKNSFPAGHPYSWRVIGEMEDLNAASLDDVHEWFKTYYGAANAVLVVAGDVDAADVKSRVEKYFGDIPSGPPVARHQSWIAKRTGEQRTVMQDRVNQSRLYMVWNVPPQFDDDTRYLDNASDVLARGKTSRLYKRLVYDDQIATSVSAFVYEMEIASLFVINATAKPGVDLAKVESAVREEMDNFLANGPTEAELNRIKTQQIAGFTRGIERIGGFGGKSDILARNTVYAGQPDFYKTYYKISQEATPAQVHEAAKTWLSDGMFALEIHPFPKYTVAEAGADRSKRPETGDAPKASFPELQRTTLSNGMKIVLAERRSVPVINFNLMVDAGYAADQFASPGTANMAMSMLDEGTKSRSALEISEELAGLGASLNAGSNLDGSNVSLSALKATLDPALDIYADVILNPAFPESDFERLKKQTLARIQREKVTPVQMALRVFSGLLYGQGHAYGNPLTGSGTEAAVSAMTREDLEKFHSTWIRPNNATMVVVGDVTMAEVKPKLEKLFKGWKKGDAPKKNIGKVAHPSSRSVYLIDKPGSQQSIIFAGHVAPPKSNPDEVAIEMMGDILGGTFTSRVNMNLREDKHWSYGAFTFMWDAEGQRPFIAYAPVQTDKTKESMLELDKELRGIIGPNPATADELVKVQKNKVLGLPGTWETIGSVGGSINEIVRFGLPDNHWQTYADRINGLTVAQINAAAKKVVHPDKLIWVVVGDREKIETGIEELGFGEIRHIDADGNPVDEAAMTKKMD